uniref:Efflux transporter, RND family, MFP subunit n=1 Tax=Rhodopseudomonas palustris (strain BisA53) TaxID=316055 RepID=Q07T75_RHOP5
MSKAPTSIGRRTMPTIGLAVSAMLLIVTPGFAAEEPASDKGAAVTVIKATKTCFAATVDVFGIVIAKEEVAVRPDRPGLKVADVLAEPGDTVTAGQTLARLGNPEGGSIAVTAPVAGTISASSAVIGAAASGREPLFSIIARNEFDLVGQVPARHLSKLAANQPAGVKVLGAEEMQGQVRRVSASVEPNSQLGQVVVAINSSKRLLANASGKATIKTGESCNVAVPLTAVLYGNSGTVVQVVRRQQVETRRVETGLMSGGAIEIREGLTDGDIVVARAGALLREGDPVRPISAAADAGKN